MFFILFLSVTIGTWEVILFNPCLEHNPNLELFMHAAAKPDLPNPVLMPQIFLCLCSHHWGRHVKKNPYACQITFQILFLGLIIR